MSKQTMALRWADVLEHEANSHGKTDYKHKAAAELRRLHEVNAELVEALNEIIWGADAMGWSTLKVKAALAKIKEEG